MYRFITKLILRVYTRPVIGGIGVLDNLKKITNIKIKKSGNLIIVIEKH